MQDDNLPSKTALQYAAQMAVDRVETGMTVCITSGMCSAFILDRLKDRYADGDVSNLKLVAPCTVMEHQCTAAGFDVVPITEAGWIDITLLEADEINGDLDLIRSNSNAFVEEKIIAMSSDQMIAFTSVQQEVQKLGLRPVPVEIVPFGWRTTQAMVEETLINLDVLSRNSHLRTSADITFKTVQGNFILDLNLNRIGNPRLASMVLNQIPGVIETGLFIDLCDTAIVGYPSGAVDIHDLSTGRTQTTVAEDEENIFAGL